MFAREVLQNLHGPAAVDELGLHIPAEAKRRVQHLWARASTARMPCARLMTNDTCVRGRSHIDSLDAVAPHAMHGLARGYMR